jgi:hypothetical protein
MSDPKFESKVQIELRPEAQELVDLYDQTLGSSAPYCCPQALASVLDALALEVAEGIKGNTLASSQVYQLIKRRANLLR